MAQFAGEITPEQLDRWIETGITSWPELLANIASSICRSNGARLVTAEMFRHWEPPVVVSERVLIAQMNAHYGGRSG